MLKLKRKLIVSILLFALSLILLLAVTLGWFQSVRINFVGNLDFYHPGVTFTFYRSIDLDENGVPDLDEEGRIIYLEQHPEDIRIGKVYPKYTTAFRIVTQASARANKLNVRLMHLPLPESDGTDITRAMKIRYTRPDTGEPVDTALFDLLDEDRNVSLFHDYPVAGTATFVFDYIIYMDENAGNEYKNREFAIDKAAFYMTP